MFPVLIPDREMAGSKGQVYTPAKGSAVASPHSLRGAEGSPSGNTRRVMKRTMVLRLQVSGWPLISVYTTVSTPSGPGEFQPPVWGWNTSSVSPPTPAGDPLPGPAPASGHLGLVVVLHGHGDDVEADDEGYEEVQVVAGAQRMDGAACV